MRWLLVLVILGGCRSIFGIGTPGRATGDGGGGDDVITDATDAQVDSIDSAYPCYGGGLYSYCTNATGAVDYVSDTTINTTVEAQCDPDVANLCVIAAGTITINANVVVTGTRPLVFVATGTLAIDGTLDASSTVARTGAGANPAAVCIGATAGTGDSGGGGGGAGGSFGSKGENGGTGDTNNSASPAGTALEGTAGPLVVSVTSIRGGCSGTAGGSNSAAGGAGGGSIPGAGGGAIYLIAGTQILVVGKAFASGGGGRTSNQLETGGGGGGAGGLVGFDAPTVTFTNSAIVAANGGAGGGGVGTSTSGASAGGDGLTMNPQSAANGGSGGGAAGMGGRGSSENTQPAPGADSDGGGGGGGAGLGVVYVRGTFTLGGAKVSPTPELH